MDKLRGGAGHALNKESAVPADFPYFSVLDAVLGGGRVSVTPVQLLDTAKVSQHDT